MSTIYVTTRAVSLRSSDSDSSLLAIVRLLECSVEYSHNNPSVRKDGKSRIGVCEPSLVERIHD